MISLDISKEDGIVIIEPSSPLEQSDFERITKEVDEYIKVSGEVNGIIIHTEKFPGWEDFSAFLHHMKFVKDHHRNIKRVAIVTDSKLGSIIPSIAKHFVSAEIKHFKYEDLKPSITWIKGSA
jgi:hypothetical protein